MRSTPRKLKESPETQKKGGGRRGNKSQAAFDAELAHPCIAAATTPGTLVQLARSSSCVSRRHHGMGASGGSETWPAWASMVSGCRSTAFSIPSSIAVLCTQPVPLWMSAGVEPGIRAPRRRAEGEGEAAPGVHRDRRRSGAARSRARPPRRPRGSFSDAGAPRARRTACPRAGCWRSPPPARETPPDRRCRPRSPTGSSRTARS